MDEGTHVQHNDEKRLAPSDLRDGPAREPMPSSELTGGPEARLTTSDLAGKTGDRDDEPAAGEQRNQALFPEADANALRERWRDVQTAFVDEPRRAVQDADALVADLMQRLAETFANERSALEGQWDRSGDVSTEEMRVALQRYRSFFDRLLSA